MPDVLQLFALGAELAVVSMICAAAALILEIAAVSVILQTFDQLPGPPAVHVGPDLVR